MCECLDKESNIYKLEINKRAKLREKQPQSANMVWEGSDEEPQEEQTQELIGELFEATLASINMERGDPNSYINFGTSKYVTIVGNLVQNPEKTPNTFRVWLEGGHAHRILGKGIVNVQTLIGEIKSIRRVFYVLNLKKKLTISWVHN